ncbi:uncharacterized protein LOC129788773 [Lutzomyia longipalpis]|uniref:uncharacterized protein LOC129788773 n=1 Tax=Lutzomyia longipalpis TaxID=7200 RepID=UPI002483FFE8|nr:uncharacterized protein LOC129788773 [Lutzomyia longipalpis]
MRITILAIFIGLCCLQMAAGSPEPGLFSNIFSGVTNTANNIFKGVTQAATNVVDTTTSVISKTVDTAAKSVSNIPVVGTIATATSNVVKEAEKVIDNTAQTAANTATAVSDAVTTTANNMATTANDVMDAMLRPLGSTNGTSICQSIDNIVNDLFGTMQSGAAMPANANTFLRTADTFTANLLSTFALPNLNLNDIAAFLGITDVPNLVNGVLTSGTNIFNGIFNNNGNFDVNALFTNGTQLLLDAAQLALLPFLIKIRFKILLALTALNLLAQAANATANAING